jgi:hypothetical protein
MQTIQGILSSRNIWFSVLLISLISLSSFVNRSADVVEVQIRNSSRLFLEGTSNVTDFSCQVQEIPDRSRLVILPNAGQNRIRFEKTFLKVKSGGMDCGGRAINKDLQKALRVEEFPYIAIQLIEANGLNPMPISLSEGWIDLDATTKITIAGTTNPVSIHLKGQKLGEKQFRFIGSRKLKMTDFGIDPPKPMLGLVKVDDQIVINFDLDVTVLN